MGLKKIMSWALVFVLAIAVYQYSRPVPVIQPSIIINQPKIGPAVNLPWPAYGQSAIGAQGYGVLATNGQQRAVPMASIAKVVTALAVLKQKPLVTGQAGPSILIKNDDLASYNFYYSQDGSVVKVESGEEISEYQVLQALLIPSANNMADTLARWAFGSVESYVAFANKMVSEMGLSQTKIADASGFSTQSLSSAKDLVVLGQAALSNPIISEIVAQQSAVLPIAGTVKNYNWLLGSDGVIGIKTGNTDQAGGCYLFASQRVISGQNVTVIGAIMSAPDRNKAISDSRVILRSVDNNFENAVVAHKNQVIGYYQTPWGAKTEIVASEDLALLAWKGSNLKLNTPVDSLKAPAPAGAQTGKITVSFSDQSKSTPVLLKNDLRAPPWTWRLFR